VIIWSDGCAYQNRNAVLASAIFHLLRSGEKANLKEVHQKYLCRGHTQMEVDAMHSSIETASCKIELFTPQDWMAVMKAARRRKPFVVNSIDHTFWKTFPNPIPSIRPGKRVGDPCVTDIKHLLFTQDGNFYSLTHATPVQPLQVRGLDKMMPPVQKYSKKLTIPKPKLADLKELCKTVIPQAHHNFFEQLI